MERRTYLATTGLALFTPSTGCLGDASTRGETEKQQNDDQVPSECPDPDRGSPMAYEEFDYISAGPPDSVEDEVVLLTTPEDVNRYDERTNVPKNLSSVDFETQCGVVVERVLTGNWAPHHLLALEREDADTIKIYRLFYRETGTTEERCDG